MNKTIRHLAMLSGLAGLIAASLPALAQQLSTSLIRPTVLAPDNGVVAGSLPGGVGSRSYYIAVDLAAGDLATQIRVTAPSDDTRMVSLEVLSDNASVEDSYYVKTSRNEQNEAAKIFPIANAKRYNLRVTVEGPETGEFCVLLGGSALPKVQSPQCPGAVTQAAAPPPSPAPVLQPPAPVSPPPAAAPSLPIPVSPATAPSLPPPPKTIMVITSKCEQRLRVGSQVLFDFDRAELRGDGVPTIDYVAQVIEQMNKPVVIEGHTDSKGTDDYNLNLSQRRAMGIELELRRRVKIMPPLQSYGYGETRPVAANEFPDGADSPEGRQLNRRVEIVINTCS